MADNDLNVRLKRAIKFLKEGDKVKCIIDWERRYKLMRTHTAAHVLASTMHKELGALITGNELGEDKTRFDFNLGQTIEVVFVCPDGSTSNVKANCPETPVVTEVVEKEKPFNQNIISILLGVLLIGALFVLWERRRIVVNRKENDAEVAKLRGYIITARDKGFKDDYIKKLLSNSDWPQKNIDRAFKELQI